MDAKRKRQLKQTIQHNIRTCPPERRDYWRRMLRKLEAQR
jgi:hypothetical protein